tara:strand:+ start:89 stop:250 length:162 start_codon:yes stop_codon:yes gene_type:complete
MARTGASKTFINSLGTWELNEDGSVRLLREAKQPTQVKERRKWRKNAGKEERV